jgi:hypothetical protein
MSTVPSGALAAPLRDRAPQPLRERDAARVDADEGDGVEVGVPLDDLVSDAGERRTVRRARRAGLWPRQGRPS